jgi:S1-C subfamily serine protease
MTEADGIPGAEEGEPTPSPPAGDGASKPGGRQRRSEWRRTEKARRYAARNSVRFPIFTRSVLLWMLIFALVGVAFGASGAFWWAHFNTQVSELRSDTQDFETRSQSASADIEKQKNDATDQINAALEPLKDSLAATKTVQEASTYSTAVYQVSSLDDQGRPSVGTAFAVITSEDETLMLTSYNTVRAATVNPGPGITLSKGGEQLPASVVNWDPANDMALLRVQKGSLTVLDWAGDDVLSKALGTSVFPVSGTGGAGATITSGLLIDQSTAGFQHTAPLGTDFQGGPVINGDGKVLGMASLAYLPLGYDNGQIHFSPPISAACSRVLNCTGGNRVPGANGG